MPALTTPVGERAPTLGAGRTSRRAVLGLVILLGLTGTAGAQDDLRVGTITIRTLNVFSPEEASRGWPYRWANALHITTRPSVIRRFLLFHEGEPYNAELLAQTERNLRALTFIKLASVVAQAPHDGVVDVVVTTQDGWTTEIGGNFGSKGGVTTYGVDLSEKNVLGTGKQVSFSYDKGTERTTRSLAFTDPYLFGPYWYGQLVLANASDGFEQSLEIARPYYALTTPWAMDAVLDNLRQNEKLYANGELDEEFRQDHKQVTLLYGKALQASLARARRLSAGFDAEEDDFQNLPDRPDDTLPDPRKFRYVFLQYDDISNDFLKMNYVNRDLRFEDFNLGRSFSLRLGVSPAVFGAPETTGLGRVTVSEGWRLSLRSFFLGSVAYQTRFGPINSNAVVTATGFLAYKFDTKLLQTFVARLQVDRGFDLDHDVQFFADGETGLRGYRLHAFEGDRRIILNFEHRIFSGREILELVAPGAVAFVDTGTAVPSGQPLTIHSFKTDAGVGLRFGIARAPSNNILRIDFGYAFNADAQGRKGWLVSFSSSQAF